MPVFNRNMNRLDPRRPEESLRAMEDYIRYMQESIEFADGKLGREVGASDSALTELSRSFAALSSEQSRLSGEQLALGRTVREAVARIPTAFEINDQGHLIVTLGDVEEDAEENEEEEEEPGT